uniref:Uncharacterized protein n=1 Tax=Tetranychus urticae TaxID=32264 RepID=T1KC67_TETUR
MTSDNRTLRPVTIWLTGISGSGKTTIANGVVAKLRSLGYNAVNLDGDKLRAGLNSDLGFSSKDRKENLRRTAEVATMFAGSNLLPVVSLISPFKEDRALARSIHHKKQIDFLECFINTPVEECERRDPKGLYKKFRSGVIKNFTGIDAPYEIPENPDLVLSTMDLNIEESIENVIRLLEDKQCIQKRIIELFTSSDLLPGIMERLNDDSAIARLNISRIDLEWVQVLSEGWATPLTGFMREVEYLECIHKGTIRGGLVNHTIPIVLSVSEIGLWYENKCFAEFFIHRKEERCAKIFGTTNIGHPTIKMIYESGDYLVGGDLSVLQKITWEDGLDQYRLTPAELRTKFKRMGADAIYAFQLRNPIHNGHALLMQETKKQLLDKNCKNPVLLLHPLGGWTKEDDVPLKVRIEQHKAVLEAKVLDPESTVLAIFPSPMSYAGPVEVQWHCKARLVTGANYYIVGRDPAGIQHPNGSDDLYDPSHGAKLLQIARGLSQFEVIPFKVAAYNLVKGCMEFYDPNEKDKFLFISGTRMRALARNGQTPPDGFMAPKAWSVLRDFYQSQP